MPPAICSSFPRRRFAFLAAAGLRHFAPACRIICRAQGCIADTDLFWSLGENAQRLRLLDDHEEILPGLTCRWAGVHHRSSMLVEADTAKGLAILSDCAFHFANVEEQRPLGIAESIIEAHAVYRDITARAKHFIPLYEPLIHKRYPGGIIA